MSSNETISSGDCSQTNQRFGSDGVPIERSLANNYLIVGHIFRSLSSSQLIECSKVCTQWQHFARLAANKRQYLCQKSLYFGLLSEKVWLKVADKYPEVFVASYEELIQSYNLFVRCNRLMQFNVIVVFSKLSFNQLQQFVSSQSTPSNSTVVHINCRNEIIGTRIQREPTVGGIEAEPEFEELSGISALFISTALPGIEVNVYKDSEIFDITWNDSLKCVLVFHIWRSLYGHFSRLKTDSEYVEHLDRCVKTCGNQLAFGGVTVERLIASETTRDDNCGKCLDIDYICCLTFRGHNVNAFSYVIDFNDNRSGDVLQAVNEDIGHCLGPESETIGLVFASNINHAVECVRSGLKGPIKVVGCAGVSHGIDSIEANDSSVANNNLFFRKRKCVLVVIRVNKSF